MVLRRLAAEGHSIIFISHKLYEVLEIADRITVIRRGKVVGERLPAETNEEDLAELMVGREVQLVVDRGESHPADADRSRSRTCRSATTAATRPCTASTSRSAPGEILGIAGVAGNGQDELVEAHHRPAQARPAGTVTPRRGRTSPAASPRRSDAAGRRLRPGDRHRFGLVLSFPVADNLVLTSYHRAPYARGILRNDAAIDAMAEERIEAFDIRTPSRDVEGGDAVGRQPAEGRRRARVRPRPARCSSSTSRRAASTSAASSSSTARPSPSAMPGRPSCSSRRSSTRSWSCPTGSPSCTAGGSSPCSTGGPPTRTRSAC